MNLIKIKNTSDLNIKFTLRVENTRIIAITLKPGEFSIGMNPVTAQLDSQRRRGFVEVDEDFDNSYMELEYGIPYDDGFVEEVQKNTKGYTGE